MCRRFDDLKGNELKPEDCVINDYTSLCASATHGDEIPRQCRTKDGIKADRGDGVLKDMIPGFALDRHELDGRLTDFRCEMKAILGNLVLIFSCTKEFNCRQVKQRHVIFVACNPNLLFPNPTIYIIVA
jgi:hypothetical protein